MTITAEGVLYDPEVDDRWPEINVCDDSIQVGRAAVELGVSPRLSRTCHRPRRWRSPAGGRRPGSRQPVSDLSGGGHAMTSLACEA